MNLIRRKAFSFLTETAHKEIEALSPRSPLAKELNEIENVEAALTNEIARMCNTATLGEITRISLLVSRLKKAGADEQESVKKQLNSVAEKLMKKVETESGPLKLAQCCRHILLGIFSSA
jgi:predicted phage-related endonuclease